MTTDLQYKSMARDLIQELSNAMGRDKFQAYWDMNLAPLRGKVFLTYRDLYVILKEEHDGLESLYSQVFGKQYAEECDRRLQQQEEQELRRG
jgi:hypothetical protein